MKRKELLSKVGKAAKLAGITWEMTKEGAEHSVYRLGSVKVSVPRHREINEFTAEGILKDLEDELGKGWWR